jgi:hypothetical protein
MSLELPFSCPLKQLRTDQLPIAAEIKEAALHKVETHTKRLPEVGQFRDLVEFINRSYGLSEYDRVVDGVKDLSVGVHSD